MASSLMQQAATLRRRRAVDLTATRRCASWATRMNWESFKPLIPRVAISARTASRAPTSRRTRTTNIKGWRRGARRRRADLAGAGVGDRAGVRRESSGRDGRPRGTATPMVPTFCGLASVPLIIGALISAVDAAMDASRGLRAEHRH